jgi:lysophospholipase L1-like esterase
MLVVGGILAGLIVAELGYRVVLAAAERPPATDSMVIYSRNFWTYDRQMGFNYVPGGSTDLSILSDGLPQLCFSFVADAAGNPGHPGTIANPDRKIYIFGDSFTFWHHGADRGTTWPSLLQERLNERHDGLFQVKNFARDGTGVLQMLDGAAEMAETDPPDLILIAFITNDLARRRFWRQSHPRPDGNADVFTSVDADMSLAPGTYVRTTFIDARAQRNWCETLRQSRDRNDPTLDQLRHAYQAVVMEDERQLGRRAKLSTVDRSYALDRIVHRDPFYSASLSAMKMWVEFSDFSEDNQFARVLDRLKHSGVPVALVWLPQQEELAAGRSELSPQLQRLADSLLRLTGFPLIRVMPPVAGDAATAYYNVPGDAHPSMKGLELFAGSLAADLHDRLMSAAKH